MKTYFDEALRFLSGHRGPFEDLVRGEGEKLDAWLVCRGCGDRVLIVEDYDPLAEDAEYAGFLDELERRSGKEIEWGVFS